MYSDLTKSTDIETLLNFYSQNSFVDLNSFPRVHLTRTSVTSRENGEKGEKSANVEKEK